MSSIALRLKSMLPSEFCKTLRVWRLPALLPLLLALRPYLPAFVFSNPQDCSPQGLYVCSLFCLESSPRSSRGLSFSLREASTKAMPPSSLHFLRCIYHPRELGTCFFVSTLECEFHKGRDLACLPGPSQAHSTLQAGREYVFEMAAGSLFCPCQLC